MLCEQHHMCLVRFSSYCTSTVVFLCCFSLLMCLRAGYEFCSSAVSVSYPTVILSTSDLHNNSAIYLIMPFPGLFPAIQSPNQSFSLSQRFINYKAKRRHFESFCHTTHCCFLRKAQDPNEIIFTDEESFTSHCKLLQ